MPQRGSWAANGWRHRSLGHLTPGWLLLGLAAAMPLAAQRTLELGAALAGAVRTTAGTPVAGARVTVAAAARHDLHTAVTGADGRKLLRRLATSVPTIHPRASTLDSPPLFPV